MQQRIFATSASVLALSIAWHGIAAADDIVINAPSPSVNLNGDDTLTITGTGSITTTTDGIAGSGVAATGNNNQISINGQISTAGVVAEGVNLNGSFSSTVINNGAIKTSGDNSAVVLLNNSNGSTVTNNGLLQASASTLGQGILLFNSSDSFVTNNGHISATGLLAPGIQITNSDRVISVNSGTVRTTGTLADAISLFGGTDNVFTNSGLVVGERADADAFSIAGINNTLNLLPQSYIGGAFDFQTSVTLNITTGPSHSVSWWLPTANVTGGQANVSGTVPWFYDTTTGQFATFDPSGLAGTFNQLGDTASLMGRLGQYGLIQADLQTGGSSVQALGFADIADTNDGLTTALATRSGAGPVYGPAYGNFWISGFGGYADHDGDSATLEQEIQQAGVAVGYGWQQSQDMRASVMAGYINGNIEAASRFAEAQDIDSSGFFAGIYGDKRLGRVTLGFGLAAGWQDNDSTRFVNDNLATTGGLTLGTSEATASYDSWYITPEVSLSTDIDLENSGMTLTPSARFRYALLDVDGYSETGSTANARVDSHTFGVFESDLELALSKQFGGKKLTGRAGYLFRSSAGDDSVPVTMLGITNSVGIGDTTSSAAYLGATADFLLSSQLSFVLDGRGTFSDDITGFQGTAQLSLKF